MIPSRNYHTRRKMRIRKKVLAAILSCTLAMFQFVNASAAEIVKEDTSIEANLESGADESAKYLTDSELLLNKVAKEGMIPIGKTTKVTYEDDLVITETEITYQKLFSTDSLVASSVHAKASEYKSDFTFYTFQVSASKGKQLLRLDQSTGFKYNGTYAYVSECEYIYYRYNGATFVNRNSGYTSSSNKSKTLAKYWISGDIKWSTKKKSYTKHRVFTASCTPAGRISHALTKS